MKQINSISTHSRRRQILDASQEIITDQSWKKSSYINNIMSHYMKTGLLLEPNKAFAKYIDNTTALPLEDAYKLVNEAKDLFLELPSSLRKQMDNDPSQLESFLSNPENRAQLEAHGLVQPLIKPLKAEPVTTGPQPSADIPDLQK